jgi:hypothetical protein
MEARAIAAALTARVATFELAGSPVRHYNPVIRGLQALPVAVTARAWEGVRS